MATSNELRVAGGAINDSVLECQRAGGDTTPGVLLGVFGMLTEIAIQLAVMNERSAARDNGAEHMPSDDSDEQPENSIGTSAASP